MNPHDFIAKYRAGAEECERDTGVPALISLAQAALESGWGARAPGHNLFGVKADKRWRGPTVIVTTHEEDAHGKRSLHRLAFRAYATPADAFRDHAAFLCVNPRYKPCFRCETPEAWCDALQLCGYATDHDYAAKMRGVVASIRKRL